ncbi:hypothetical protein K0651_07895 [Ornithinimicrobium sp. Arc0846-15]|nr:hypothetical protein [Ornithinimicrobium laminariae]
MSHAKSTVCRGFSAVVASVVLAGCAAETDAVEGEELRQGLREYDANFSGGEDVWPALPEGSLVSGANILDGEFGYMVILTMNTRVGSFGQWQQFCVGESERAAQRACGYDFDAAATYLDAGPPPEAVELDGLWVWTADGRPVADAAFEATSFEEFSAAAEFGGPALSVVPSE